MPVAKQREYRALVNLSVGRVERGPNGREERAERVERGNTVYLTEPEARNFGRFVRLVETEETTKIPERVRPAQVIGISNVSKLGVPEQASGGALDLKNETHVISSEAERDEEAQPYNNPIEPSYRGDDAE
jgi:hypothetical protein